MTHSKHYPDRERKVPSGDSMKRMVRRKIDAQSGDRVEAMKRALRHSAHVYHTTDEHVRGGLDVVSTYNNHAESALYGSARALVAAELIVAIGEGLSISDAVMKVLGGLK